MAASVKAWVRTDYAKWNKAHRHVISPDVAISIVLSGSACIFLTVLDFSNNFTNLSAIVA